MILSVKNTSLIQCPPLPVVIHSFSSILISDRMVAKALARVLVYGHWWLEWWDDLTCSVLKLHSSGQWMVHTWYVGHQKLVSLFIFLVLASPSFGSRFFYSYFTFPYWDCLTACLLSWYLTLTLPFPEGDVLKLLNSLGLLSLSVSTKKARAMIWSCLGDMEFHLLSFLRISNLFKAEVIR